MLVYPSEAPPGASAPGNTQYRLMQDGTPSSCLQHHALHCAYAWLGTDRHTLPCPACNLATPYASAPCRVCLATLHSAALCVCVATSHHTLHCSITYAGKTGRAASRAFFQTGSMCPNINGYTSGSTYSLGRLQTFDTHTHTRSMLFGTLLLQARASSTQSLS